MAKRKKLPPPPKTKKVVKRSKKKLTQAEIKLRAAARKAGKKPVPPKNKKRPTRTKKQAAAAKSANKAKKVASKKAGTVKVEGTDLSLAQTRQLLIVFANPGISPAEFAKKAWPDAPGWKAKIRTGTGPNSEKVVEKVGGAMVLAAGAALGKLKGLGLATFERPKRARLYSLTATGEKALDKARKAHGL